MVPYHKPATTSFFLSWYAAVLSYDRPASRDVLMKIFALALAGILMAGTAMADVINTLSAICPCCPC